MSKKLFVESSRSLTELAGSWSASGSISQRYGSADPQPDPYLNFKDPQRWNEQIFCSRTGLTFFSTGLGLRLRLLPALVLAFLSGFSSLAWNSSYVIALSWFWNKKQILWFKKNILRKSVLRIRIRGLFDPWIRDPVRVFPDPGSRIPDPKPIFLRA